MSDKDKELVQAEESLEIELRRSGRDDVKLGTPVRARIMVPYAHIAQPDGDSIEEKLPLTVIQYVNAPKYDQQTDRRNGGNQPKKLVQDTTDAPPLCSTVIYVAGDADDEKLFKTFSGDNHIAELKGWIKDRIRARKRFTAQFGLMHE